MASIVRGQILRDDLALYDGVTRTDARTDATGGTVSGLNIGNSVDVLQVFGSGTDRTVQTINDAVSRLGGAAATFEFATGTWTIDEDLTIPVNVTCRVPSGCVFNVASGKTLTLSGLVLVEDISAWTSGSGTVTVSVEGLHGGHYFQTTAESDASITPTNNQYQSDDVGYINVKRFGALLDGSTDDTTAVTNANAAAVQAGVPVFFPKGTCMVSTIAFTAAVRWIGCGPTESIIKCSKSGSVQEDFITVTGSVSVYLRDIGFDGNSKVDRLVSVTNSADAGAGETVKAFNVDFKNTESATQSSAGLRVVGGFDEVTCYQTLFESIQANGASNVASGLHVNNSSSFYVKQVRVALCGFDSIGPVDDGDGINSGALTGTMNESHLSVTACWFRDCEKRAVKCQMYSALVSGNHIERTADHSNTADPEIAIQAGGGIVENNKYYYALGAYAPGLIVQINNTLDGAGTGHVNPSRINGDIVFIGDSTALDHYVQINCDDPTNGNNFVEVKNVRIHGAVTKFARLIPDGGSGSDIQIDELLIEGVYVETLSGTNNAFIWGNRLSGTGANVEIRARVRNNYVGTSNSEPYYNEQAGTAFTAGSGVDFTPLEWSNNINTTQLESSSGVPTTITLPSETATGTYTASLAVLVTDIDSSGGAVTLTIPDGQYEGQRKVITMSDASTSSTVSVTSHETSDPEVFTFAQTTDYLVLEWSASQAFWWTVKNIGAAV